MRKLTAVVTSYNSEKTITRCLHSVRFADEVIVLDSFSTDTTEAIVRPLADKFKQQTFKGYSQQKQDAIDMASHRWVLLLDSDEYLNESAQFAIKQWQRTEIQCDGYYLPRKEWVFWRWSHSWVHKNEFLRLFDQSKAKMTQHSVHETVKVEGMTKKLNAEIQHMGETSIAKKMEKINIYSTLAARDKYDKGKRCGHLRLWFYPMFYFFRQYLIRRQVLNGGAGLVNATLNSYYAYLKYAKLYELQKKRD